MRWMDGRAPYHGDTHTAAALQHTYQTMVQTNPETRKRIVVLVTDGDPQGEYFKWSSYPKIERSP